MNNLSLELDENIKKLYIYERMNAIAISKHLNLSQSFVYRKIDSLGLKNELNHIVLVELEKEKEKIEKSIVSNNYILENILNELSITKNEFFKLVKKHNITFNIVTIKELEVEKEKNIIKKLYIDKNLNLSEISEKLKIPKTTLQYKINTYGLDTLKKELVTKLSSIEEEVVDELYVSNSFSILRIANILGKSESHIKRIVKRKELSFKRKKLEKQREFDDVQKIKQLYEDENNSSALIARKINRSYSWVRRKIIANNFLRKNSSELSFNYNDMIDKDYRAIIRPSLSRIKKYYFHQKILKIKPNFNCNNISKSFKNSKEELIIKRIKYLLIDCSMPLQQISFNLLIPKEHISLYLRNNNIKYQRTDDWDSILLEVMHEYFIEKKSLKNIAEELNISISTLYKKTNNFNSPISGISKEICNFIGEMFFIESISAQEIADIYNLDVLTVFKVLGELTCDCTLTISEEDEILLYNYLFNVKKLNSKEISLFLKVPIDLVRQKISNFKLQEKRKCELISQYLNSDLSAKELSEKLNINYKTFIALLNREGVEIRKKVWTDFQTRFLIENINKLSVNEISKHIKKSPSNIRWKCRKLGISLSNSWSESDLEFLESKIGSISMSKISKILNRPLKSVETKAYREGFGSALSNISFLTANQLASILNVGMSSVVVKWIKHHNLKATRVVIHSKKSYWKIKVEEFWRWAYNNQDIVSFAFLHKNILGKEPDWVDEKRNKDMLLANKNKAYSLEEDEFIIYNWRINSIEFIASKLKRNSRGVYIRGLRLGLKKEDLNKYCSKIDNSFISASL